MLFRLILVLISLQFFGNAQLSKQKIKQQLQNEDFEVSPAGNVTFSNQVIGWICNQGSIQGMDACNIQTCCVQNPTTEIEVINCSIQNGYVDPVIGSVYPIYSVFGNTINAGASVNVLQT